MSLGEGIFPALASSIVYDRQYNLTSIDGVGEHTGRVMRRMAVLSKNSGVLRLNPAKSIFGAITRIVGLGIDTRGQKTRDQHRSNASHCERVEMNGAQ